MLEKKALGINEPDINDEDLDGDGDVDLWIYKIVISFQVY